MASVSASAGGSISQRVAAGGRWTAFSAAIGIIVQFSQLAVLGRLLEPADFGLIAMLMVVIGLFSLISDLGVGNFIVQAKSFTARHFGNLLIFCTSASFFLACILLLLSPAVAIYYQTPILEALLPAMVFILTATAISQIFFAVLQREMRFRSIALGEVFSSVSGLVVSIVFAVLGKGVWALIAGQWVLVISKLCFYGIASTALLRPQVSWNSTDLMAPIRFGSFQIGERLLNYAGWNIDKLVIGRMLGEMSLGIYSVAYQLVVKPFSILNPIFTRVAFPLFSQIQDDNERLCRGYLKLTRTVAAITFPVYVVIVVAADAIIYLLMGPKWSAAADLLSILGVLGFIYALGNPIGTLLLAKGRADLGFYYNMVAFFVYAVFIYIGIYFGLRGAAVGLVFAAVCILFPLEFLLRWHLIRMRAHEYISAIAKISLAALLAIIFALICSWFMDPINGVVEVALVRGGVALIVYSAFLWFFENKLIKETYLLIRYK